MYEEVSEEFQLTVVELPIEFADGLLVYRECLKESTFLSAEASSQKKLHRQFLQVYLPYREKNRAAIEEEETTSLLLSIEQLLKYYDGETFDGF